MQQPLTSNPAPAGAAPGAPDLSVVIATPGDIDAIRQTLRHLQAQTVRHRIEVVIVGRSRAVLCVDEAALAGFHSFQVVELGSVPCVATGNAAGIRQARGAVVALAEDHCFPAPGWAEALLEAHRGPWDVVGPVVVNANPGTAISWADFLLGYGPWLDPTPAGRVAYLPGHNSAYKRNVLLRHGDALETWLESEVVLHWEMQGRGGGLYLEPAARTYHFNYSRLTSWLQATFYTGRTFAARRMRPKRRRLLQRLLYTGAAPLIPLVRFRRFLRDFRRAGLPAALFLRILPAVACQLVVGALGEAVGYAFGPGDAPRRISEFEFNRDRHVTQADQAAIAAARFYASHPHDDTTRLSRHTYPQASAPGDTGGPECPRAIVSRA